MKILSNAEYAKLKRADNDFESQERDTEYWISKYERLEAKYNEQEERHKLALEFQKSEHENQLSRVNGKHEAELITVGLKKDKEYASKLKESEARAMGKEAEVKGLEKVVAAKEATYRIC